MNEEAIALANRRMEVAKERLELAIELLDSGRFRDAVNRSYYAIFAAMRVLLALKRLDSKSHKALFILFHNNFVKTGLFSKEFTALAERAKNLREMADYDEVVEITEKDARKEVRGAMKFVDAVEKYSEETIKLEERKEDSKG